MNGNLALRRLRYLLAVLFAVLIIVIFNMTLKAHPTPVETAPTPTFDTSPLLVWCRGDDIGTVRMIGATAVAYDKDTDTTTLESDDGQLWDIIDTYTEDDELLLLWIADNHTPQDVTDDIIIKIWREAR